MSGRANPLLMFRGVRAGRAVPRCAAALFCCIGVIPLSCANSGAPSQQSPAAQARAAAPGTMTEPQALNLRGVAYVNMQNYDRAIADFSRAIYFEPDDIVLHQNRGVGYYGKGQVEKSLADFSRAVSLKGFFSSDERIAAALALRGDVFLGLGRYQDAVDDFTRVLKVDRNRTDVLVKRGKALVLLGKHAKAIEDYRRAAEQYPQDVQVVFYQGVALFRAGRLDDARGNAGKVIELSPRAAMAYSADNLLEMFDLDKRRAQAREALGEAQGAEAMGDLPLAFKGYERAFFLSPTATPDDLSLNEKVLQEGIVRLYPQLAVKPELPEVARRYQVRAQTLIGNNDYDQAIAACRFVLSGAYWSPEAQHRVALLSAEKKRYADAIRFMMTYTKLVPGTPEARVAQDQIYAWESMMQQVPDIRPPGPASDLLIRKIIVRCDDFIEPFPTVPIEMLIGKVF